MRYREVLWICFLGLLFVGMPDVVFAHPEGHTTKSLSEAGSQFHEQLNGEQREKATFSFDHAARTDWSYYPGSRAGVALADLQNQHRRRVHQLLQSGLSSAGYSKVNNILHIEEILGRLDGYSGYDPEKYYTAFFGVPNESRPWAVRFEGHHLSLNYTFVNGEVASVTPAFFGANPAVVPDGPYAGKETLVLERQLARQVVQSLDEALRQKAIFRSEALEEIVTEQEEEAELSRFKGIPLSKMDERSQSMLKQLIRVYTGNFPRKQAKQLTSTFLGSGMDRIYFAWAGAIQRGEPHYYRIHAPGILIEYDNVQDGVNHIHSVIRSFDGDFGRDVLAKHYENSPHHEAD